MGMKTIPSLESNFTPIPHSYLEELFRSSCSREEIVVTLFCFHRTYGWKHEQGAIRAEAVARDTNLGESEALLGLQAATERGFLLRLPLESDDTTGLHATYLLNTPENRRFVDIYCDASPSEEPLAHSEPEEAPRELPNEPTEPNFPIEPEAAMEEVPPMADESGEMLLFEDELPSSPVMDEPPPVSQKTDGELPYHSKTLDMLVKVLGRALSKSEKDRLMDMGASDTELIEAMSSLLSKTKQVYSSDLVIYEYERLRARDRQAAKYEKVKAERDAQHERQKSCKRCEGLGYIFVGLNNVRECDCRKDD